MPYIVRALRCKPQPALAHSVQYVASSSSFLPSSFGFAGEIQGEGKGSHHYMQFLLLRFLDVERERGIAASPHLRGTSAEYLWGLARSLAGSCRYGLWREGRASTKVIGYRKGRGKRRRSGRLHAGQEKLFSLSSRFSLRPSV